jgi:hypothetical protein
MSQGTNENTSQSVMRGLFASVQTLFLLVALGNSVALSNTTPRALQFPGLLALAFLGLIWTSAAGLTWITWQTIEHRAIREQVDQGALTSA